MKGREGRLSSKTSLGSPGLAPTALSRQVTDPTVGPGLGLSRRPYATRREMGERDSQGVRPSEIGVGGRAPKILSGPEVPGLGMEEGYWRPHPLPCLNRPESNLPSPGLRKHRTEPSFRTPSGEPELHPWLAARRDRVRGWGGVGDTFLRVNAVNLNFRSPKIAPLPLRSIHHHRIKLPATRDSLYLEAAAAPSGETHRYYY